MGRGRPARVTSLVPLMGQGMFMISSVLIKAFARGIEPLAKSTRARRPRPMSHARSCAPYENYVRAVLRVRN